MDEKDKYTITDSLYTNKDGDMMFSTASEKVLDVLLHATERLLEEKKKREEAMPSDEFKRICTVSSAGMLLKQAAMIIKEVAGMDLGTDSKRQVELGEKLLDSLNEYGDFIVKALENVKELDVWKEKEKEKEKDDEDGDDSE